MTEPVDAPEIKQPNLFTTRLLLVAVFIILLGGFYLLWMEIKTPEIAVSNHEQVVYSQLEDSDYLNSLSHKLLTVEPEDIGIVNATALQAQIEKGNGLNANIYNSLPKINHNSQSDNAENKTLSSTEKHNNNFYYIVHLKDQPFLLQLNQQRLSNTSELTGVFLPVNSIHLLSVIENIAKIEGQQAIHHEYVFSLAQENGSSPLHSETFAENRTILLIIVALTLLVLLGLWLYKRSRPPEPKPNDFFEQ